MKRVFYILTIILVSSLMTSCASYVTRVKSGQTAKTGSVYLIGKVSFDPEPSQYLDNIGSGQWKKVFLGNFSNQTKIDDHPVFNFKETWGEYFIWEIPRQDIFLQIISVITKAADGETRFLRFNTMIPFTFEKDDRVVYIGDLLFKSNIENEMGGKDIVLQVTDNSKKAIAECGGLITDTDGNPVLPKTKLVKGGRVSVTTIVATLE